jgi:hypothetical protein
MMKKIRGLFLSFLLLLISISAFSQHKTMISGKVLSNRGFRYRLSKRYELRRDYE